MPEIDVIKNHLVSLSTPASVLAVIANDLLTEEFFTFEIETVIDSLESAYGVEIIEENVDKLQAIQVIYTTNSFYMDIPTFLVVVDAFSGDGVDFDDADVPQVDDVASTIVEVLMNVPEDDMDNLFAPDVLEFIKAVLKEEGFHTAPQSLYFIGDIASVDTENTVLSDPIISEAYYKQQEAIKSDVEATVSARIQKIITSVETLPMKNRNTESWNKFTGSIR